MNFNLLYKLNPHWFYEADKSGGQGANEGNDQNNQQNNQGAPATVESFDAWYASQNDDTKKLADPLKEHFERMQNTVKDTRKERDTLSKQVRDAANKLEAGSEDKKNMEKLANDLDSANRRADFYQDAPSHECRNAKAAHALAVANDLFKRDGSPDWKAIQAEAPELFGKINVTTKRTAGSGTNQEVPKTQGINDWIRSQAGVNITQE